MRVSANKDQRIVPVGELISLCREIPEENLVYKRNAAAFFPRRFSFTSPVPVTQHPSRKQFFARLFGFGVAFSVFPRLFAKSSATAMTSGDSRESSRVLEVRPEARAVARRPDSA